MANMRGYMAIALGMAAMMSGSQQVYNPPTQAMPNNPKKIIPKGCKEYTFWDNDKKYTYVALTHERAQVKFFKEIKQLRDKI